MNTSHEKRALRIIEQRKKEAAALRSLISDFSLLLDNLVPSDPENWWYSIVDEVLVLEFNLGHFSDGAWLNYTVTLNDEGCVEGRGVSLMPMAEEHAAEEELDVTEWIDGTEFFFTEGTMLSIGTFCMNYNALLAL